MDDWAFETKQLHSGQETPDPATGARAVPIYQNVAYVFENSAQAASRFRLEDPGHIYARLGNPTQDVLEKRMAALEGGAGALALASGAAAVTYALLNLAQAGDHLVSAGNIYGGTHNLLAHTLPHYGIATTFTDESRPETLTLALRPNTKAIFVESLGNPHSAVTDLEAAAKAAHAHGIPLIVDNTFATPYLLRPLEHGADIVVHSATKFIDGHGTSMGGLIVDGGTFDWAGSGKFPSLSDPNPSYHGLSFTQAAGHLAYVTKIRTILLRDTGAAISPFNAFMLLQGLETLSLRMERHTANALQVVGHLKKHPRVEAVHHPSLPDEPSHRLYKKYFPQGAGSIFTFEIAGGVREAHAFTDRLRLFSLLANVADMKSLVIHPATTTHSQLNEAELLAQGIKPNTIRLSIGTENIRDILADLDQALSPNP